VTDLSQLTWAVARTGGFVAYGLLTASVVFGLILGLGWRSRRWTRFVTTETHRFITVVGLVFIVVHGIAILLDPFIGFTPLEILVPGLSHYRPLYVAFGVVGGYLAIAVWASEYLRSRIGYRWWRRFHAFAFLAWALAAIHGIGTGTDTRSWWALAIYGGSVALVGGLIALRLRPRGLPRPGALRPAVGALALAGVVTATAWTIGGPLQPGWNRIANNGNGNGSVTASASTSAQVAQAAPPRSLAAQAFSADLSGTVLQSADASTILIDATLSAAPGGRFQLIAPARVRGGPSGTFRYMSDAGTTCVGTVTSVQRGRVGARCVDQAGGTWDMTLQLGLADDGSVVGTIAATPDAGGAAG
jgi:hypothetical protein